jgi:hypothetical protein
MTFHQFNLEPPAQLLEDLAQLSAQCAIYCFSPVLRYFHYVVPAVPLNVSLALPFSHLDFSSLAGLAGPAGEEKSFRRTRQFLHTAEPLYSPRHRRRLNIGVIKGHVRRISAKNSEGMSEVNSTISGSAPTPGRGVILSSVASLCRAVMASPPGARLSRGRARERCRRMAAGIGP